MPKGTAAKGDWHWLFRIPPLFTAAAAILLAFIPKESPEQAGYPGVVFGATFGLMAPAHTPPAIIDKFHRALMTAMGTPEMRKQLADLGYDVVANSPAEYGAFIRGEIDTWSKIVRDYDIKGE